MTGLEQLARFEAMLARWEADAEQLARDLADYSERVDAALIGDM